MSLGSIGSLQDISFSIDRLETGGKAVVAFPQSLNARVLKEKSLNLQPVGLDLIKTGNKWGLYLKSISLYKSFEFFLNVIKLKNEIYFIAITWDYGGNPPNVYPPVKMDMPVDIDPSKLVDRLKIGEKRVFPADGIPLWPCQHVVGGLNFLILVYECDKEIREMGTRISEIHEAVKVSSLVELIGKILINPTLAIGAAVKEAVDALAGVIGSLAKKNGDDYVDLFRGTFAAEKDQKAGIIPIDYESFGIELEFTIKG